MITCSEYKIKKRIVKPLDWPLRTTVPLIEGDYYWFTFDGKIIRRCELMEVFEDLGRTFVTVRPLIKGIFKFKYHTLFADEIGRTKEEAVLNTVTW